MDFVVRFMLRFVRYVWKKRFKVAVALVSPLLSVRYVWVKMAVTPLHCESLNGDVLLRLRLPGFAA
jgi:hypothetical protein